MEEIENEFFIFDESENSLIIGRKFNDLNPGYVYMPYIPINIIPLIEVIHANRLIDHIQEEMFKCLGVSFKTTITFKFFRGFE